MAFGSTKSSRLKISFVFLAFGIGMMSIIPIAEILAQFQDVTPEKIESFNTYWPAFFLISIAVVISMLTAIITHLIPFDAQSAPTFKVLGIEAPIELKGASLLLIAMSVAVAIAAQAWDLTGLAEVRGQQTKDQLELATKEGELKSMEEQRDLLLSILAGERNREGIEVLSLVVACGTTEADKYSNWEVLDTASENNWNSYEGLDKPLAVGHRPRTYRMRSQEGNEIIRLEVEFTEQGVVQVDLDGQRSWSEFCELVSEPIATGFSGQTAEHATIPSDSELKPVTVDPNDINQSSKRDG